MLLPKEETGNVRHGVLDMSHVRPGQNSSKITKSVRKEILGRPKTTQRGLGSLQPRSLSRGLETQLRTMSKFAGSGLYDYVNCFIIGLHFLI